MFENKIKDAIFAYYLKPFLTKKESCIGIELEFPIVNLNQSPVDIKVLQKLMEYLVRNFSFNVIKIDNNQNIIAINNNNNDVISFEYSFNTLEFSMSKNRNLRAIARQFYAYIDTVQKFLKLHNHLLTGLGIHPYFNEIDMSPINTDYYNVLYGFMELSRRYFSFSFPECSAFMNALQIHIDCDFRELPKTITFLSKIDWVTALLFSNSSFITTNGVSVSDCICYRDIVRENTSLGLVKSNIGVSNQMLQTLDHVYNDLIDCAIWHVREENQYIYFEPMTIKEFFQSTQIDGFMLEKNQAISYTFSPKIEHIKFYRGYKNISISHYGTLELKSICQQPISDVFTPIAFIKGVLMNLDKINNLIQELELPYSNYAMRRIAIYQKEASIFKKEKLSKLLLQTIDLAYNSLKEAKHGEEIFLEALFQKAKNIICPAKENLAFLKNGNRLEDLIFKTSVFNF